MTPWWCRRPTAYGRRPPPCRRTPGAGTCSGGAPPPCPQPPPASGARCPSRPTPPRGRCRCGARVCRARAPRAQRSASWRARHAPRSTAQGPWWCHGQCGWHVQRGGTSTSSGSSQGRALKRTLHAPHSRATTRSTTSAVSPRPRPTVGTAPPRTTTRRGTHRHTTLGWHASRGTDCRTVGATTHTAHHTHAGHGTTATAHRHGDTTVVSHNTHGHAHLSHTGRRTPAHATRFTRQGPHVRRHVAAPGRHNHTHTTPRHGTTSHKWLGSSQWWWDSLGVFPCKLRFCAFRFVVSATSTGT